MPIGHGASAVAAGNALLSKLVDDHDAGAVAHISVHQFDHGGSKVRGLRADESIQMGSPVLVVPRRLSKLAGDIRSARFRAVPAGTARLGIWLAERRVALAERRAQCSLDPEGCGVSPTWHAYVDALPSLRDYQEQGLPIVAPDEELRLVESLPRLGGVASWVRHERSALERDLDAYNTARGNRPRLTWDDALWGRATAISRSFESSEPGEPDVKVVPGVDLLNHAGADANVTYGDTETHDGAVVVAATRDIKRGEELTVDYAAADAETMLKSWGITQDAPHGRWAADDCARLRAADLGNHGGAFLRTMATVVSQNCPNSDELPAATSRGAQVMPAELSSGGAPGVPPIESPTKLVALETLASPSATPLQRAMASTALSEEMSPLQAAGLAGAAGLATGGVVGAASPAATGAIGRFTSSLQSASQPAASNVLLGKGAPYVLAPAALMAQSSGRAAGANRGLPKTTEKLLLAADQGPRLAMFSPISQSRGRNKFLEAWTR